MPGADARILGWFSNLRADGYQITSQEDAFYNCIAWAAGTTDHQWWPNRYGFWPPGIERTETVDAFVAAFATLGFGPTGNGDLIADVEKIALYADEEGKPTHMARQLPSGTWTSKLGRWEDIEHQTLEALEGRDPAYGRVVLFLERPIRRRDRA